VRSQVRACLSVYAAPELRRIAAGSVFRELMFYDCVVPAVLDDMFYPVLLSSMQEPLARAELDAYFSKLVVLADEGILRRRKYVVIVIGDVTHFTATGRRQVADAQARFMTAERNDVTLAAFIPIDNSFVRGALTALRWLSPEVVKSVRLVPSLEIALSEALSMLESERHAVRRGSSGVESRAWSSPLIQRWSMVIEPHRVFSPTRPAIVGVSPC